MPTERWEIIKELGRGGQGIVNLVRDTSKPGSRTELRPKLFKILQNATSNMDVEGRRDRALNDLIDILPRLLQADSPDNLGAKKELHDSANARNQESAEDRIRRELDAMVQFSHSNLLKIIDSDKDKKWFVSEYHPGGTLDKFQAQFAGNVKASLTAIRPIVQAVSELHKAGIVHRDIKPANIFSAHDGRLVLGDFGLVFFADSAHTRLTESLENVGSWDWMPIWAQGVRIDEIRPSFDVFSLGKIIWWMVSGLPIQRLQLWYFERPILDVQKLFPNAEFVHFINPILRKCVVEHEADCLGNATDLLVVIDEAITCINRNADGLQHGNVRHCKVCGVGTYERDVEHNMQRSIGVQRVGNLHTRVERCNRCGNVQVFVADEAESVSSDFRWIK